MTEITKAKSHTTDRHISRVGTKLCGAHLKEELVLAFSEAARQKGTTVKDLLEQFVIDTVKDVLPRSERERIFNADIEKMERRKQILGL